LKSILPNPINPINPNSEKPKRKLLKVSFVIQKVLIINALQIHHSSFIIHHSSLLTNMYPFKFLDAYKREDKAIFFGRDEEKKALYEMILQTDLLVVYGASGTGKTSLIECGLANCFETHDWLPINVRRGLNINDALEQALQKQLKSPATQTSDWLFQSWDEDGNLILNRPQNPLARTFKTIYLQSFKPIYLILDQFEELYVLGSQTEQIKFYETIQLILHLEQPIKILISIREEYLGCLYGFERVVPELLRKKLRVESMNLEKVTMVIKKLSELKDSCVRISANEYMALAQLIFEKVKDKEKTITIQLPYLQVFLDKFYLHVSNDESRQAEVTLSVASLKEMGDLGDILRHFLDHQVLQMAHDLQLMPDNVWLMLSPLVTLEGTKEPTTLQMLAARLPEMPMDTLQKALEAFVQHRILRLNEQAQAYEVAHDALARQIHAKRSDAEIAILEVQRLVKAQMSLKVAVRDYFTEKQLLFMEPYLPKFALSATEQQWIGESRAFRTEEKRAEERRKAEELTHAQETAQLEKQLREKAERQRQLAKQRSRIAIGIAALAMLTSAIAVWQYFNAKNAQQIMLVERDKAQDAADKTKQVLDKIYFYKDRFGLAYDKSNQKYGCIDQNLNTKIKFEYDEAFSFDTDGFAEVKLKRKVQSEAIQMDMLIDTLGREYKLATDIEALDRSITALKLMGRHLSTIPPIVFEKTQLQILLMGDNELVHLPKSIGQLAALQVLDCSKNKLTSLSAELGKLSQLRTLDLSSNQLTSLPVELGKLSELQMLYLSNNQLPSLSTEFSKLTNLLVLNLEKNPISRTEKEKIKRLLPHCNIQF
jgi:hypothetical protein